MSSINIIRAKEVGEGGKVFTYRVHPEGMEPDVSEFVVPAEFEKDFSVAFEEVHLDRKKERKSGRQLRIQVFSFYLSV